ncbi:flagellar hook-associated protein FlgL [uncultured Acetatifactor sp.]|uniref:flagellar hook-associated protein FlgL n=1 Tax=uncultured Acetatifactor sp. TaxID=1671927 RepID=UPI00263945BD|nr:flagellar hook-associated protein FlgL [uncultured Acetatifactor sp.]
MRITNKIMQRNNLSNINTNKMYQDKLSTQMSTQKKINRPSEDPVVAIRSLRLRSNVTEITQYYSKNIPDAESWIKITEDSLSKLSDIIANMAAQCTRGTNSDFTTTDRGTILEQLKLLADEVYATGDADYAGRYVFTGLRTDTPLSFLSEQERNYTITEQLDKSALDEFTSVNTGKVLEINSSNYNDNDHSDIKEDDITSVDVHRIRLAYNDCSDGSIPKISFIQDDGKGNIKEVVWADGTGTATYKIEKMNSHVTNPDPYTYAAQTDNAIVYIPETGELLLGENAYKEVMAKKDLESTSNINEGEIRITYEKSHWQKGDLRPEHYFACEADKLDDTGAVVTDDQGNPIRIPYNDTYLTTNAERQVIEYDVGFNQTIRINSRADECFKHGIGREVDDIIAAMENVQELERAQADIKAIMEKLPEGDAGMATLQNQLDAVEKALTYAEKKEQKMFEGGISAFQKYLDEANLCVTACGSRGSKLDLIKNRSQNQKTTYETLKSQNEDIDITEVAIQLTSAELTYDAALMAAGKVMQTSLMNFI